MDDPAYYEFQNEERDAVVADVGSGGLAALLQARAESGVPVSAVLGIFTLQPDAIFTTEGSGINSLKDLEGKKVGVRAYSVTTGVWTRQVLIDELGYRVVMKLPKDKALGETLAGMHEAAVTVLVALVALHALAALYHHYFKRDTILMRMLPWLRRPT